MDNFETTVGQLRDNFEITWKRLYFTFGPHGDFVVTISGASSCLVASIWSLLILQLAFKCALCFKPFFASTSWSSGPAEKYEQVIGSKGPPAFLCFPIFSFLFKKTHFLSPQKCQKLLMPSSMLTKKSKNVFCNSCLVGFVCNIF